MITPQERKYRELILQAIVYQYKENSMRHSILNNFMENSRSYYEQFCDMVYQYVHSSSNNLFINNRGVSFIDEPEDMEYSVFLVLSKDEKVIPCDDIIVYIDKALSKLQKQVEMQFTNSISSCSS